MADQQEKGRRRQTAKAAATQAKSPPAAKGQEPEIPGWLQAPDQEAAPETQTITTFDLRRNLGKVLDTVAYRGASYTVTNYGKPVASITSAMRFDHRPGPTMEAMTQMEHSAAHPSERPAPEPPEIRSRSQVRRFETMGAIDPKKAQELLNKMNRK